ncbi:MAG: 16S rRNA (cytidine(1402)-2'-O)-methyltransferase [Spirochaetes bacterium]|nr:16S rRNA (cytidine(1402)-2'-O)-methyltransferase [Spirochaetota bacterium]
MRGSEQGTLFVVGTPIGNLKDVTHRALEVLQNVRYIACEDTRVTLKLLNRYGISKTLVSYHSKSGERTASRIEKLIEQGNDIALVTDGGTPGVSDPGNELVARCIERGVRVEIVPGPSAVSAVLSGAGIRYAEYTFLGFLSAKPSRRRKKLETLKDTRTVFVIFESPHRIVRFLEDLLEIFGCVTVYVAKEMTKRFEKYYRGTAGSVLAEIEADGVRGEYTVVVDNRK